MFDFIQKIRFADFSNTGSAPVPPIEPPANFSLFTGSGNGGDTGYYRTIYGDLANEPLSAYPLLEFATRNTGYFQIAFTGDCLTLVQDWQPVIPGITLGAALIPWAFDGSYTSATWDDSGQMTPSQNYAITWEALQS